MVIKFKKENIFSWSDIVETKQFWNEVISLDEEFNPQGMVSQVWKVCPLQIHYLLNAYFPHKGNGESTEDRFIVTREIKHLLAGPSQYRTKLSVS